MLVRTLRQRVLCHLAKRLAMGQEIPETIDYNDYDNGKDGSSFVRRTYVPTEEEIEEAAIIAQLYCNKCDCENCPTTKKEGKMSKRKKELQEKLEELYADFRRDDWIASGGTSEVTLGDLREHTEQVRKIIASEEEAEAKEELEFYEEFWRTWYEKQIENRYGGDE